MLKNKIHVVWLDINSSYSHSSLALPAIEAQNCERHPIEWKKVSGTINSTVGPIVEELLEANPDIIAYTAWLFNHEITLQILSRYKTLRPNVMVIGGGPEYMGCNSNFLKRNLFINIVSRGEGEELFYKWIEVWQDIEKWSSIEGLCYLNNGKYIDNGAAKVKEYTNLRYPETSKFFDWSKPFIQIESSRGCFNSCAFCVSGNDKPVRSITIEELRNRLERAKENGIRDIRLLDRTFNGTGKRAIDMLSLFEEFADSMQFHLEVHPALFSQQIRDRISTLPNNVLHIEAGVQSLSQKVLDATGRYGRVEDVIDGLKFLTCIDKFEVHSDLISGLPHYTLKMIYNDIRALSAIGCSEIQLELLKLLPGTAMRINSAQLNIKYSPSPPYEVLETDSMTFSELEEARKLSKIVDIYYNSDVWREAFRELIRGDEFFLKKFTQHIISLDVIEQPMSLERKGLLLFEYCEKYYTDSLVWVTVCWIKAGLSLKKGAGAAAKVFNTTPPTEVAKQCSSATRLYKIDVSGKEIWFGFDRSLSHSTPIFITIN